MRVLELDSCLLYLELKLYVNCESTNILYEHTVLKCSSTFMSQNQRITDSFMLGKSLRSLSLPNIL